MCRQVTSDVPTVSPPPRTYGEAVTLTFTADIIVYEISIFTCVKPGSLTSKTWLFSALFNAIKKAENVETLR